MINIARFEPMIVNDYLLREVAEMVPHPDGDFVQYKDYEALYAELENWKKESIARGIYLANAIAEAGVLRQQHKEMVSIVHLDDWAEKRFAYYQAHPNQEGENPCTRMWQDLIVLIEYMRNRVDRNNDTSA